ncbi:hypothetical protein [Glutamicibacter sp. NPDC087344]|uniref:hypothetical protein n=1 Tax=Glutamicibacter sp. NPDC087344 TaxID=3363994 RepID=UPI0038252A4E
MPIIVAQHDEKLGDVMALAAAHKPPVLVATLDPESENICFTYVAIGCSDLEIVAVRGTDDSIIDLYRESRLRPCITFRVAPLLHSAIAHALPPLHKATGARYPALAVDHTEGGR